jgi:hypothetical protein
MTDRSQQGYSGDVGGSRGGSSRAADSHDSRNSHGSQQQTSLTPHSYQRSYQQQPYHENSSSNNNNSQYSHSNTAGERIQDMNTQTTRGSTNIGVGTGAGTGGSLRGEILYDNREHQQQHQQQQQHSATGGSIGLGVGGSIGGGSMAGTSTAGSLVGTGGYPGHDNRHLSTKSNVSHTRVIPLSSASEQIVKIVAALYNQQISVTSATKQIREHYETIKKKISSQKDIVEQFREIANQVVPMVCKSDNPYAAPGNIVYIHSDSEKHSDRETKLNWAASGWKSTKNSERMISAGRHETCEVYFKDNMISRLHVVVIAIPGIQPVIPTSSSLTSTTTPTSMNGGSGDVSPYGKWIVLDLASSNGISTISRGINSSISCRDHKPMSSKDERSILIYDLNERVTLDTGKGVVCMQYVSPA